MPKPCGMIELMARIEAPWRRSALGEPRPAAATRTVEVARRNQGYGLRVASPG